MSVSNSVRLGVFRDRPVFEAAEFAEVVVPAHIAAYAGSGLWGFLQGIATRRGRRDDLFRYDPMTYLLYIPSRYWVKGPPSDQQSDDLRISERDLRPALHAMLESYGLLEPAVLYSVADARREFVGEGARSCLEFQRRGSEAAEGKTIAKYSQLLGRPVAGALAPSRLVAPYAALDGWSGAGYRDQVELNMRALQERRAGEVMWTVLALNSLGGLRPPTLLEGQELALRSFDGVGVWVGGFDEYAAPLASLLAYRQLVRVLEMPVWLMFGGYFSLLLSHDGVVDVSHGVFYTETKLVRGLVGSGPAPDRYYIEKLHRFYDPVRAFSILRALPSFLCDCPDCGSVDDLQAALVAAGRDNKARIEWTQRLQRHFLWARAREVRDVSAQSRSALVTELADVAREAESAPASQRLAMGLDTTHLRLWVEALR